MKRWREAYDAAGIAPLDTPPPDLVAELARVDVLAASDMRRAIESAERLAGGRPVVVSPLFRETPVSIPTWSAFRAPLGLWGALLIARWSVDIVTGKPSHLGALHQARRAAAWCIHACDQSENGDSVVAIVTHGVFRRLLARELLTRGWRYEPGRRSYDHWSVWRLAFDQRVAASRR
jgi:broad specificity phosphatase PhoE